MSPWSLESLTKMEPSVQGMGQVLEAGEQAEEQPLEALLPGQGALCISTLSTTLTTAPGSVATTGIGTTHGMVTPTTGATAASKG